MISVTVVGERLEIDVFEDGHVEFSRFMGDETVESDGNQLDQLILEHGRGQDVVSMETPEAAKPVRG